MKPHIRKRLLRIAKRKVEKTLEQYPELTGAYLTPIEVRLLLDDGYVTIKDGFSMVEYQLSKIPEGDCSPTWVYFRNTLEEKRFRDKVKNILKKLKQNGRSNMELS